MVGYDVENIKISLHTQLVGVELLHISLRYFIRSCCAAADFDSLCSFVSFFSSRSRSLSSCHFFFCIYAEPRSTHIECDAVWDISRLGLHGWERLSTPLIDFWVSHLHLASSSHIKKSERSLQKDCGKKFWDFFAHCRCLRLIFIPIHTEITTVMTMHNLPDVSRLSLALIDLLEIGKFSC